ncbi:hypothetical protein H4R34_005255 [Dimargaris verticillata]|uniref:Uncharacterized protein n=1 Tax=Dimargaris verticillata TaxID=2761393 RepID=A0A9W8AXD1_9FUNG|nr:hypothetical protein H4R34_005255 [Dimargaris verticillata]
MADQLTAVSAAPQDTDSNGSQYYSHTISAGLDISPFDQKRHQPAEPTSLEHVLFSQVGTSSIGNDPNGRAVDSGHYTDQRLRASPPGVGSDSSSPMDKDTEELSMKLLRTCVNYEGAYIARNRGASLASLPPGAVSPQLNKQLNNYFSNIIVQVNQYKYAPGADYTFPPYAYGPPIQFIDLGELKAALERNDYIFILYWDDDSDMLIARSAHDMEEPTIIDCYDFIGGLEISTHFAQLFTLPFDYSLTSMYDLVYNTLAQNVGYGKTEWLLQSFWADFPLEAKRIYDQRTGTR